MRVEFPVSQFYKMTSNIESKTCFLIILSHYSFYSGNAISNIINILQFLFLGKFFDTSFGMGYLMSPYAAAYANGLTNGSHMVRKLNR